MSKVKSYIRKNGSKVKAHVRKSTQAGRERVAGKVLKRDLQALIGNKKPRATKKFDPKKALNKIIRSTKRANKRAAKKS